MSELTEVGKAFAGWVEENSGLAVDENFEYTDRTVGNFAAVAFAAGAQWQAQRKPTDAEVEAAAIVLVGTLHGYDPDSMPSWDEANDIMQQKAKEFSKHMLEAARKAMTE
jgi:hypothetical protein